MDLISRLYCVGRIQTTLLPFFSSTFLNLFHLLSTFFFNPIFFSFFRSLNGADQPVVLCGLQTNLLWSFSTNSWNYFHLPFREGWKTHWVQKPDPCPVSLPPTRHSGWLMDLSIRASRFDSPQLTATPVNDHIIRMSFSKCLKDQLRFPKRKLVNLSKSLTSSSLSILVPWQAQLKLLSH